VLTNIILNAKDAIRQARGNGIIQISLSREANSVFIRIKDDGIGMSKETLSRIFDPFFTTKEVGKGLGLGLSICQAIVEKHKGTISAESEVNKGTVFIVRLPAARERVAVNAS
jgi:signal transduction histidine kinase